MASEFEVALGLVAPVYNLFMAVIAWSIVHLAVLAAMAMAAYLYLDLRIFNRTKKMEAVLPESRPFIMVRSLKIVHASRAPMVFVPVLLMRSL